MTPDASTRMAAWLESAWLARYLDRALTDSEAAWFETYVLDKPYLLTMIESDTQLRDALAQAEPGRGGTSSLTEDRRADVGKNPHAAASARWSQARKWIGIAALFLVGLGVGLSNRELTGRRSDTSIIPNPTRITFDTMRGMSSAPVVDLDGASILVLVEIPVPLTASDVKLIVPKEKDIPLAVSRDGFASFLFPRNSISPGLRLKVTYMISAKSEQIDIDLPTALEAKK